MTKTLEEIFKEAAEQIHPFDGGDVNFINEQIRRGIIEGMSLMYKVLGWRDAGEKVAATPTPVKLKLWGSNGDEDWRFISATKGTIPKWAKYWRYQTPLPTDLTTLETLIQEQIKKGGKE